MELNYVYSESTVRPPTVSFETDGVRLTRNIQEVVRDNNGESITYFTYEECVLTHAQFQSYTNIMMLQAMSPQTLEL